MRRRHALAVVILGVLLLVVDVLRAPGKAHPDDPARPHVDDNGVHDDEDDCQHEDADDDDRQGAAVDGLP